MGFVFAILGIIQIVVGVTNERKRALVGIGGLFFIVGLLMSIIWVISGARSISVAGTVFLIVGIVVVIWAIARNLSPYSTEEKRHRRILIGVGLFPFALGLTLILVSTLTSGGSKYETYSGYGFSIEYAEGRSITANVVDDETTGTVTNSPSMLQLGQELDKAPYIEMFNLSWETLNQAPGLSVKIDSIFERMKGTFGEKELNRLVNLKGKASGYLVRVQGYSIDRSALKMSGVVGVWYCERNKRLYTLDLVRSGEALKWALTDGLKEYERYLTSFVCLEEGAAAKVQVARERVA